MSSKPNAFDENLRATFSSLALTPERMPSRQAYYYGDYCELVTIISNGNLFSAADLRERFKDNDIAISRCLSKRDRVARLRQEVENVLDEVDLDEDDLSEDDLSEDASFGKVDDEEDTGLDLNDDESGVGDDIGSRHAELLDREEAWSDSVFSMLQERCNLFGDDYPFEVSDRTIQLKPHLSSRHHIYLTLLLASNLKYFGPMQTTLTREFEEISFQALRSFLPPHAIVKQFGKNSEFQGTAEQKIRALAQQLKIEISEEYVAEIEGNQERGLDIVGWVPFVDGYANFLSVFGQCACQKEDWAHKQIETRRYDSTYYRFEKLSPIHALFVPKALYRTPNFYESDELIHGTLLFERRRILQFITDTSFFEILDSQELVKKCIEYEEDLV